MNYQLAFFIPIYAFAVGLLVYMLRRTWIEWRSRVAVAAAAACAEAFELRACNAQCVATAYANAHVSLRLTRYAQDHDVNTWLLSDMTLHVPNAALRLLYVQSLFDKLPSGHTLLVYVHLLPMDACHTLIDDGWEREGVMMKKRQVSYTGHTYGEDGEPADWESAPAPKTTRSEEHAEH